MRIALIGLVFALLATMAAFLASKARRGRDGVEVLDTEGRRRLPTPRRAPAPLVTGVVIAALALILLATSVRVVPVGHGLVDLQHGHARASGSRRRASRSSRPSSATTQLYDLRRLEYTMSGVSGEGRKSDIDDSLWSPTQEGLQVGIDLTVWHHLDPSRVIAIHRRSARTTRTRSSARRCAR